MPASKPILTEQFLREDLEQRVFSPASASGDDRVGVEVEFFPLVGSRLGSGAAQPDREGNEDFPGLFPWLNSLAEEYGWLCNPAESAALAFRLKNGGAITLEPGGQVEYSSPPFLTPEEALADVAAIETLLCREGGKAGLIFTACGFNRWLGDAAPRLVVQKPRYLVMDRHFEEIGPYGRMMMRQTCATQINLDFGSPEFMERRWRLANLASPALNALFANSPSRYRGTDFKSFRYEIWRHTDPCRTGSLPGLLESDPVSAWLSFALEASVMLVPTESGDVRSATLPMSFRQWIDGEGDPADRFPDAGDWELHLTTLFPDVRPRGFLELRLVDALPGNVRNAAVVLATGLLYNRNLLTEGLRILEGMPTIAEKSEKERFLIGKMLLEYAAEEMDHAALREYYRDFARKGATPADREVAESGIPALIQQN